MNVCPVRAAVISIVLMIVGTISAGAGDNVLTLDTIVETAIRKNPGITYTQQEVEAARARVMQATSAYLPQVSAVTDYSRLNTWKTNVFTGNDFRGQYDYYRVGISVSQYLYDFGQTSGKVDSSRYALSASEQNVVKTVADTVRDTKKVYFEVLKRQNLVKVSQESIRIQEEHLNQARAFYQAGIRPKIDVTKSETEYANSRLTLIRTEYALNSSRFDLETLLGGPPAPGPYQLADVPIMTTAELSNLQTLIQEANERRPEISGIKDQIKAGQAMLSSSEGSRWPTISANAGSSWENREFPLEDYWQVGLSLSWPLFTGFRTQGKIAEYRAEIDKLLAKLKQTELLILNEVSVAFLGLNTAIEAIGTSEQAVKQAQENLDLADGRYRNGVGNAIEYSDAELALTQAKSNLVQAAYQYYQQTAELDHAVGR